MEDAWFTTVADELASCLVAARECAETCERLLERLHRDGRGPASDAARALLPAAAAARVLVDAIDRPPELAFTAVGLCRELALGAARRLAAAPGVDASEAVRAIRAAAASCDRLLDAAGAR